MKKVIAVLSIFLTFAPAWAKKDKETMEATKDLKYGQLCNQQEILDRFAYPVHKEGLTEKLSREAQNLLGRSLEFHDAYDAKAPVADDSPFELVDNTKKLDMTLTSEQLDLELIKDFYRKKIDAMSKTLGLSIAPVAFDGFFCALSLAASSTAGPLGLAAAITRFMSSAKEGFKDTVAYLKELCAPENDKLYELELKYVTVKRFLNSSQQEAIERLLTNARHTQDYVTTIENVSTILNLPIKDKLPNFDIEDKILALTDGYILGKENAGDNAGLDTKGFGRVMLAACANHIARFSTKSGPAKGPRSIVTIQGPPGIGKTYLIKEVAKIMGLNYVEASLNGGPKVFFGTDKVQGTLVKAYGAQKNPHRGVLLCLDEADFALNVKGDTDVWLQFLEACREFWPCGMAGDIDVSHWFIVLLSNGKIENAGLLNRLQPIYLAGLVEKRKREIALTQIIPPILQSDIPALSLKLEDIPAEQLAIILDEKADPGFRTIQKMTQMQAGLLRLGLLKKLNRDDYAGLEAKDVTKAFELMHPSLTELYVQPKLPQGSMIWSGWASLKDGAQALVGLVYSGKTPVEAYAGLPPLETPVKAPFVGDLIDFTGVSIERPAAPKNPPQAPKSNLNDFFIDGWLPEEDKQEKSLAELLDWNTQVAVVVRAGSPTGDLSIDLFDKN